MEEALKSLEIQTKVLARRSNAMWDILLVNEEQSKKCCRQRINNKVSTSANRIHGHSKDQSDPTRGAHGYNREEVGVFEQVDVSAIVSKAGIATAEFILQITMSRKEFNNIPDILVIVEV